MINIDELKFDEKGLIPAIVQDHFTGKVLMLAYMNKESADNKTLLESIRQIFREEVQTVAVVSAPPAAVAVTPELTEEQNCTLREAWENVCMYDEHCFSSWASVFKISI